MSLRRRAVSCLFFAAFAGCLLASSAMAQSVPPDAIQIQHPAIQGGKVFRFGKNLFIVPHESTDAGSVTIPRICGSLRASGWHNDRAGSSVSLRPEPTQWVVEWQSTPAGANAIVLDFDQEPKLPSELEPVKSRGDGSIMLEAYQAVTSGEKLRYEPQPSKNTVGYWTVPTDTASWRLRIDAGGEYTVGILHGCGAGHGGSRALLSLQKDEQTVAALEFEVVETGHFQNFQWRHLGRLAVSEPGVYSLIITPMEIQRAALMDVRAIHLVRLPVTSSE